MNKETEQPEVHVKVRSYGLTELGLLYNPSLQPRFGSESHQALDCLQQGPDNRLAAIRLAQRPAQVYTFADATDIQVSGRALRIEN